MWLSGDCHFSKGVISDIEPEVVARRHHLAELEMIDSLPVGGVILIKNSRLMLAKTRTIAIACLS